MAQINTTDDLISLLRIGRSMPNELLFDANALVSHGGVLWYQLRDHDPGE